MTIMDAAVSNVRVLRSMRTSDLIISWSSISTNGSDVF